MKNDKRLHLIEFENFEYWQIGISEKYIHIVTTTTTKNYYYKSMIEIHGATVNKKTCNSVFHSHRYISR